MGRHGRRGRRSAPAIATALTATAVATLGAGAAPAAAQMPIELDHVTASEVASGSNGNGVVEPGERVAITPSVIYADFAPLTDLVGNLATASADTMAVVETASAAWPEVPFGEPTASATPFVAAIDAAHACGVPLRFTLGLSSSVGTAEVPVSVSTGAADPAANAVASSDQAVPIPDGSSWVDQTVTISAPGRVRSVKVSIPALQHDYSGDLRLTLIAPDGRSVVLSDQHGGGAQNAYTGTVFSDAASEDIRWAAAPYTGSFKPEEALSGLDGALASGTWTLRVEDRSLGGTGVLDGWSLTAPAAQCAGTTVTPPPPTGPTLGNGHGKGNGFGTLKDKPGKGKKA